ncbi:DinB family protein [Blastococcus sp. SYSU D00669]
MSRPELIDEKSALLAALRSQREHVLGILDGLPDEELRRPVLPSGWSCLGLVKHLAVDVERFWFRAVIAGEQVELQSGDGGWRVPDGTTGDEVLALYRDEAARADAVIGDRALDAEPAWWPTELFPGLPVRDLRQTVLAVIVETATHAGHLDAVRELIDGRTWLVLTG